MAIHISECLVRSLPLGMELLLLFSQRSAEPCLRDSPTYNHLGTFSPPSASGHPQESLALLSLNFILAIPSLIEPKL